MRNYGTTALTNSSPQQTFAEPLTLAEVKSFLELPERSPSDPTEDAMLEGMITAAREQAEVAQGRDLVQKQYDLLLDHIWHYAWNESRHYASGEIFLRAPLVSVDLLRYRDSDGVEHDLTENTDYIVDLARGLIMPPYGESWASFTPWPSSAVLIRYTAGYGPTDPFWSNAGQRVLLGMKALISHWFVHRLPFDTIPGQTFGEFPFGVTALLGCGARRKVY